MRQYLDAYEATGTGTAPTGLGVQAFSAGLLFARAASNAGADLTRETLVAEVQKIDEWDGGGLHGITNPAENTAKVDLTVTVHGLDELSRLLTRFAGLPNVISARRRN